MEIIKDLLEKLYFAIEKPAAYGPFHLLFMIITIAIMIAFCIIFRKSSDTTFRIVLITFGAFLISTEVLKQIYYLFVINGKKELTDVIVYEWDVFPFQLCSVPMYLAVIAGSLKKCRLRDAICDYLATIGLLGGIMAYLEPSGILHAELFSLVHSCIWHALLIFIGLYIIFTNNTGTKLKHCVRVFMVLLLVICTATFLNLVFYSKASSGFNMCYISPFRGTPLAVFNTFDKVLTDLLTWYPGRILSICIYIFALCLGGFVLYCIPFYSKKLFVLIKNKKKLNHNKEAAK